MFVKSVALTPLFSVYLFTESGSYLSRYERADEYGHAGFLIPAESYKFRVDYEGSQYWSEVVTVIAHEQTDAELSLEQLALNLTNDPNPVRFEGSPPVFKREKIRIASIGSLSGILSQSIIANTSSPRIYYYLNDHLGTPQLMTDEEGEVVWKADYKPFGEASVDPDSIVTNNFTFPGQYYDQETGLHYNYHRYYHSDIARYIVPDLVGLLTFCKEKHINHLYSYVKNNPINFIDPLGLDRYNPCKKLPPVLKWLCKKYVDFGCRGTRNVICCEAEKEECLRKMDWCASNAEEEAKKCYAEYLICISKTKYQ
jgi:RHS repeat-associated protein